MIRRLKSQASTLGAISLVSLCVVLPFLKYGIPSGHDFEFHFNSWIEVVNHWKQGVWYPHWAALAHYGYGEARFIFYPPLSWTFGAVLGLVLPWKLVCGAYIWIVLTLAGCSMFVLARHWLSRRDAMFAAIVYAVNPYHLLIVYWRSAMAELMAAIYLPLLLLLVLRSEDEGSRIVVPLSLLMAAGWLTNLPAAVMMTYSLGLLAVCAALARRSIRPIAYCSIAAIIGAALAGFYLAPAYHQQTWVNIGQVFGPGVRPQDNFLFTMSDDLDHNRFNLLVSVVALWVIVITAVAMFFSRRRGNRMMSWLMAGWSVFCTALMLRPTLFFWMHLPELRFVQLPWRWLLCLNLVFALALSMALRRWWLRGLICAVMLGVVLLVGHRVQPPWWDTAADINEMVENQHEGIGNEGTDEYVPAGTDPYEIDQKAPLVRFEETGGAPIRIDKWQSERREITANTRASGKLILRLFNYSLWRVLVNGRPVKTETTVPAGQLVVPVTAGENHVRIKFIDDPDRTTGFIISTCAFVVLLLWFFISRKLSSLPLRPKPTPRTETPL